tara:strand:- start:3122 stop:3505 length:384 start_codon:yes stop_codon:yes gene_type:complete
MNSFEKKIIIDLDDTICTTSNGDYKNSKPKYDVIKKMQEYKYQGFKIVIFTSRNMRTHKGNIGLINANTLPIILTWLKKNNVPFDEVIVGKPWPSIGGFYVDDKAIRPDEFINLNYQQIKSLINDNS